MQPESPTPAGSPNPETPASHDKAPVIQPSPGFVPPAPTPAPASLPGPPPGLAPQQPQFQPMPGYAQPVMQPQPYPGYGPQGYPQQYPGPVQLNEAYGHDKLAIASVVLGVMSLPASILTIFTLPLPVVGFILGAISLKRNKGLAIAGMILSSLGLLATIGLLVLFVASSSKSTSSSSSSSSGSSLVADGKVDTDCYSFDLPSGFVAADITAKSSCGIKAINEDSSEDIIITAMPLASTANTEADKEAYLKLYLGEVSKNIPGTAGLTQPTLTSFGGSTAYKITGNEQPEAGTTYKYLGLASTLTPKPYTADGKTIDAFFIAFDSHGTPDRFPDIAKSFQWK